MRLPKGRTLREAAQFMLKHAPDSGKQSTVAAEFGGSWLQCNGGVRWGRTAGSSESELATGERAPSQAISQFNLIGSRDRKLFLIGNFPPQC